MVETASKIGIHPKKEMAGLQTVSAVAQMGGSAEVCCTVASACASATTLS